MSKLRTQPPPIGTSLALLCLFALCMPALPAETGPRSPLKVGDRFPDLAKYELEGSQPGSLRGKIVVIDFWASWCAPCQKTFPLMEELHVRYGKRGLVILAINEDRSRAAKDEFLKEHPVTFRVLRDAKKKLAAEINVPALPTSYLIDGEGKIRSIHPGAAVAANSREFVKEIETLVTQPAK